MKQLPPHVATANEPIDALGGRNHEGPDMTNVMPISMMLGVLHQCGEDDASYARLWTRFVSAIGGWIGLTISRDGDEELGIGLPCDSQMRHRSRWLHFLSEDLDRRPEARDLLILQRISSGQYADNRPADPQSTTRAIRDFLRTEGRILIDPEGNLTEGGGLPKLCAFGADEEAAECVRAGRAYYAVRRRWRSEQHIKRAVQMLGKRTGNGWIVLERRREER